MSDLDATTRERVTPETEVTRRLRERPANHSNRRRQTRPQAEVRQGEANNSKSDGKPNHKHW
jgi:hypothetical protein